MKLKSHPTMLNELVKLVNGGKTDINSLEVMNCKFSYAIQGETVLDASRLRVSPEVVLLIAKIAATSPSLHTVNLSWNKLKATTPKIVKALIPLEYLKDLNLCATMYSAKPAEYIVDTAKLISDFKSLKTLNLGYNDICELGPLVAKALAKSNTLETLVLHNNLLEGHCSSTVEALSKSTSLNILCLEMNSLDDHLNAIATALFKSTSIKTVKMVSKQYCDLKEEHEFLFNGLLASRNSEVKQENKCLTENLFTLFTCEVLPKDMLCELAGYTKHPIEGVFED